MTTEQLKRTAYASYLPSRHVSFSHTVQYKEYDDDSRQRTKWVTSAAGAPRDEASSAKPTFDYGTRLPEILLKEYIDEMICLGNAGLDELEEQLMLFLRGLPYAKDDY